VPGADKLPATLADLRRRFMRELAGLPPVADDNEKPPGKRLREEGDEDENPAKRARVDPEPAAEAETESTKRVREEGESDEERPTKRARLVPLQDPDDGSEEIDE
jgi:hypothetical protein